MNNIDQEKYSKFKNSFWTFFIRNSRMTFLALIAVLGMGLFSLFNLQIESNPEINQPIGIVSTIYPNSSATDVEEQITEPLEDEIENLDNLDSFQSTSSNNISTIIVTFESDSNTEDVLADLREAVNKVENRLPEDAQSPTVTEIDFNGLSIVTLSVIGSADKEKLSELAEQVKEDIEDLSGVSNIELSGDLQEEVQISLKTKELEKFGITLNEVINAINNSSINAPIGQVTNQNKDLNIRLLGKIESLDQLRAIPVKNISREGVDIITLNDISEIDLVEINTNTASQVSEQGKNPVNAVSMNVFKKTGGNIVSIVNSIDQKIIDLNKTLPGDIRILKTNDNSIFIKEDIENLSSSGMQTVIVIFLTLLLFIAVKESLVATLAIPFIFFITFTVIYFQGDTLNGLTIFSLILSLGLIVDTTIVVIEGIHEYINRGDTPEEAAMKTLFIYRWPLIAGTFTTIAAFFPLLLVGGIVGEFIKTIPLVLNITLIASLFVSFSFSPLIAAKILKQGEKSRIQKFKERFINKLKSSYGNLLEKILKSRSSKVTIVICTIILFFASMSLPFLGILKAQLFPVVDVAYLNVNITAPEGTQLDEMKDLLEPVNKTIRDYSEVDNYVVNIGRQIASQNEPAIATAASADQAGIIVNLVPEKQRDLKSFELADELRDDLSIIDTPLDIEVVSISAGPPVAAPFEAKISGPDINKLEEISLELKQELENTSGIINVSTQFDDASFEAVLKVNQEKASFYGANNQSIALLGQTFTTGITNGTIDLSGEEYDLRILFENSDTKKIQEVLALPIATQKGIIPLSEIGKIDLNQSIRSIPRIDGERTVSVTAFTESDVLITEVLPEIQEKINNLETVEPGYSVSTGGEDEDIQESFADLFSSMIVAVILILVILVLIFSSFRQTFIVLFSVPLSIIGIFPGLQAFDAALSFPAFLGVVMLTGIVVNDAIVLVDQINITGNLVEAAKSRLLPIILTTLTTTLGIIPITITDEFWRELGFSVIFGLLTATFLTLFLIPILYSFAYRKKFKQQKSQS